MSISAMKQALEAMEKLADETPTTHVRAGKAQIEGKEVVALWFDDCSDPIQQAIYINATKPSKLKEFLGQVRGHLRQAIAEAEKQEQWKEIDMAYRPGGIPQDFTKHEVEAFDDWSEWVNPNNDNYMMKCCDCGLVHEMQFKVVKYSEGDECEFVADADLQPVFRARRTTTPAAQRQWTGLTDADIEDAFAFSMAKYIEEVDPDFYSVSSQADFVFAKYLEAKLKEKNSG